MNLIGERIRVLSASDPTLAGLTGRVMLETLNTLLVESHGKNARIAKAGTAIQVVGTGAVFTGADIAGRPQDRLGRKLR